ncbi:pro-neuregulin-1, membrane-bound isoform isoform X3 [Ammospiza nelsoni]|uniref:pro-neuregulin-1, membrane-bound isoform isoform X2 n=1 Tax=Ammospiza caudacuta TaxID=2857398 RepID=UPI0027390CD4|nr:pro-neuregulin-1, membrane-bound isoform isoform X2 [Ammospiza caudacuta]XP_059348711.1 pro-neuregulin-1, membrane-bound isoform isoform X3 [Ammospiza nelsoni]
MSEVAADTFPSPSAQLSPDASLNGLPDEENMPGTQREDRRVQGIAGLAATCCVCLEAERLKGCLNSEKICIAPILACLLSLCLCIAGLKWVFVDKIFEYDSPTHLDPGRIGQDPKSAVDPTALSAWVPSEVYASPFLVPSPKSKAEVTVHSDSSLVPSKPFLQPSLYNRILDVGLLSSATPSLSPPALEPTTASQAQATETNLQTTPKLSTSTSTTGTSHLTKCDIKQKAFCVNGGECYMVKDLPNPPRYLCRCPNEFTGDRCQNYVMASFYKAEELYQKRVLTITGICIALLVVGIMCVVAYCKTKKQRKKLHDRLRQSLRSERNNVMNMANGPHHPNPPPDNVQLVNQYVSKNVISSEHVIERETETSFSTSHYTSTTHHSVTVTQTSSHSWSNGHTESILSESHSVLVSSSMENSRHASPAGPRGRLNGIGGPREGNCFLRHARETPDSYRDSPHSERYVSAMTTPARMSPVDFHTPTSPKSRPSTMSPPASSLTVSIPSVAVSPFIEEERPLLLVTPLQLHEKYEHHLQQFNSFHHNATHESSSLPPSPLRIVEDEEYETTQEYEPAQEPPKKLTNSRRVKRTKPNGHISSRVEVDSDTSSESSSSETETEDERIGEDTPFLSIPNPGAAGLEPATAFRLAETRTNPANRFSTPEELQARLSSVIANQDPIAV